MSEPRAAAGITTVDEALSAYAELVERLRRSYDQLEQRAQRIESDLERVNAELEAKVDELDRTTRHLNAILDALPVGVAVEDESGSLTRLNPAADEILRACGRSILESEERSTTGVFELSDGTVRHLRRSTSDVLRPGEDPLGRVHVIEDESESVDLRTRLTRHATLVALGEMAAEIAHEIRNPLNAVEGFANLLLRRMRREATGDEALAKEQQSATYAQSIVRGVREVDGIITNLMTFASAQQLRLESLSLEEVVREAIEIASRGLSAEQAEDFGFEVDIAEKEKRILGDRIKLRQVFRNLVANAIEAMEGAGTVRIQGTWKEDSYVHISIEDEGPGVDPGIAPKLFRPFATGKAGGTGLGLALVHRILEAHGGSIELVPSDRGACFQMKLPRGLREGEDR